MSDVNKVAASAGAQWLLDGFSVLRKAPVGLATLGLIWGALSLLVAMSVGTPGLFVVLQLVLMLLGPLLAGGFVFAVRSVEQGGKAVPAHLLEGFHGGRSGRLLLTLLPNVVAMLVCIVLLAAMIGPATLMELSQALEQAAAQSQPDPEVFAGLPVGRLLLWLLLVVVIAIVASFFTFVAIPEIMFTGSGAFAAMGRSFRACIRNLPALLVLLAMGMIVGFAFYLGMVIVGLVVRLVAGDAAMQVVTQLLLMAVFMPVMMGAVYAAWRQMLGAGGASVPATASSGFEA